MFKHYYIVQTLVCQNGKNTKYNTIILIHSKNTLQCMKYTHYYFYENVFKYVITFHRMHDENPFSGLRLMLRKTGVFRYVLDSLGSYVGLEGKPTQAYINMVFTLNFVCYKHENNGLVDTHISTT